MSPGYQCHSISQPRPDDLMSIPDLMIKGLDKLQVSPTGLPVAHQTAINIQQVSLVSNRRRIHERPCERSQRGFSCEYLFAQVCNVMLLSHKCSCQRHFFYFFAHPKWLGNKQRSTIKKYQRSRSANSRWKKYSGRMMPSV